MQLQSMLGLLLQVLHAFILFYSMVPSARVLLLYHLLLLFPPTISQEVTSQETDEQKIRG